MNKLNNLRLRLVLWTILLETVLMLIFGVVLVTVLQNARNRQIDETLHLSASQLNAVVDVSGGKYQISQQDSATLQTQGIVAWILNPQGEIATTVGGAATVPLPTSLPAVNVLSDINLSAGETSRVLVSPLLEGNRPLGTLVLAVSLHNAQTTIQQVWFSLGIAIPFVLLLSGAGGLFLANRALAPVATITRTARQISTDDLSRRLLLQLPNDEIGELAQTFDAMLERLQQGFERERQLTADVSHDLRTPLGMLKAQLSLARSRSRDANTLLGMMADMEGDVDRMTRLTEQMLTLTRVEQSENSTLNALDLGMLLQDVVASWRPRAQELGIRLTFERLSDSNLQIHGDRDGLRQVFDNHVDNALKYTCRGDSITISAYRKGAEIEVRIADTGVGIAPEHLSHLFERFYRADSARTSTTGGFGLGLAISQAVIQVHKGHMDVSSELGCGTTFAIRLPVDPA